MFEKAIQDYHPSHCFGCGADNPQGHQIKTYWNGEVGVCDWTPKPFHDSGGGFLYGGVVASVFDCHQCCTAIAKLYEMEGVTDDAGPRLWAVTAHLEVDYLKPTLLHEPVHLEAKVEKVEGKKLHTSCTLTSGGQVTAKSTGLFIRVE
jgi:acyl-coenzyme A thioesterase PaaI-like protein